MASWIIYMASHLAWSIRITS